MLVVCVSNFKPRSLACLGIETGAIRGQLVEKLELSTAKQFPA